MRKFAIISCALVLACGVRASWYWPFGSDEGDAAPLRVSELMEPASLLIDEASDLASEGKIDESVEKYRKALSELDRIEMENPERAKTVEFATLRNKRAYVNAAIDSMLLGQVRQNAKVVAVSDTTELERKLAEERGEKKVEVTKVKSKDEGERRKKTSAPATPREQVIAAIESRDYATAEKLINEMLRTRPNGAMALNLRAAMEMRQGKLDVAEETLDQAIMSNPRNHSAYYNLAMLLLQKDVGNRASARRYYETGRAMGGPENPELEALLK